MMLCSEFHCPRTVGFSRPRSRETPAPTVKVNDPAAETVNIPSILEMGGRVYGVEHGGRLRSQEPPPPNRPTEHFRIE